MRRILGRSLNMKRRCRRSWAELARFDRLPNCALSRHVGPLGPCMAFCRRSAVLPFSARPPVGRRLGRRLQTYLRRGVRIRDFLARVDIFSPVLLIYHLSLGRRAVSRAPRSVKGSRPSRRDSIISREQLYLSVEATRESLERDSANILIRLELPGENPSFGPTRQNRPLDSDWLNGISVSVETDVIARLGQGNATGEYRRGSS